LKAFLKATLSEPNGTPSSVRVILVAVVVVDLLVALFSDEVKEGRLALLTTLTIAAFGCKLGSKYGEANDKGGN